MLALPEILKKNYNKLVPRPNSHGKMPPYKDLCIGRNWLHTFSLQWNPINLATNGSQKSGPINRVTVLKGFFKREKD